MLNVKLHKSYDFDLDSFLREDGYDFAGRTYEEIVKSNNFWLEMTHNYIQVLFPIDEESAYFKNAPTVTMKEARELGKDIRVRKKMHAGFLRMLIFYKETDHWQRIHNHNYLRFSRILRSLRMFGLNDDADIFYNFIMDYAKANPKKVTLRNVNTWKERNIIVNTVSERNLKPQNLL